MANPNEELLRKAYEGDLEAFWRLCANDFTWIIPGRSQVAGAWKGKEQFFSLISKVMELTEGTFREEVHDVVANDEHAVVLVSQRFERGGRMEYRTAHVYHIRDGKLMECWEQPQDQYVFDEAWA